MTSIRQLTLTTILIPGLSAPLTGLGRQAETGGPSVFDPIQLPDEPKEAEMKLEENPLVPWWQTNQPPSNLITGSQLGTDVFGSLSGFNPALPPLAGGTSAGVPPAFRWGAVTFLPSLSYGVTYGNGLLGGPDEGFTVINTVSPRFTFELGQRWMVAYAPSFVFYTADTYQNTVNQNVTLQGTASQGDWDFNLGNNFGITDNPLVETGTQTQQTGNTTQFGASRPLSSVLSLDLGLSQALRWSEEFNNTFSWSTQNGVNYQLRRQLSVGAYIDLGYDLVEPGTDMTHEGLKLSVNGSLGDKLTFSFSPGFELRQFLDTDAQMKLLPLQNGNLNYAITEKTSFNVFANRQVSPSYYDDQFTESASLGGGVSQRLFGKYYLSLSGGFRWSDYNSTLDPTDTVQSSNYAFMRVGLSSRFLKRGSASIYYSWSNNDSSDQGLAYTSNQVGLQMGYGW